MEQHKTRVALYMRVAREDDTAINAQKESLCCFAKQHGYSDPVCFEDNGYSGLNLDRPGFKQLDEAINAGSIQIVMVKDISRIGRSMLDVISWIDGLAAKGVHLVTAEGVYENSDLPDIRAMVKEYIGKQHGRKGAG